MMRLALFGFFCLVSCGTRQPAKPSKALVEEWEAWKQEHGKTYPANTNSDNEAGLGELSKEESFRMNIWSENKAAIEKHNRQFDKGVHTFKLAMNQFGDLLRHEFVSKMNGMRPRPEEKMMNGSLFSVPANSGALPATVDWRKGRGGGRAVTPVKNQNCGDCWAFAAVAALEAAHQIKTGQLVSLSEQQLVDCSGEGCNGGWPHDAYNYVKKNGGLDTEHSYPVNRDKGQGKCVYKASKRGATCRGYNHVQWGDENALKSVIALQGPCSVVVDAHNWGFYHSGIYNGHDGHGCSSDPQRLDHAVLVVGYGTEKGKDYWLVKNSWGTGWGEEGYMKLARNAHNLCGVANFVNCPLV